MNETSTWDKVGEGKDAVNQPRFSRFEVVTVERLENADLMFEYKARQGTIIKEMAEDNVQRRMEKLPRTETVELFRTNAAGQRVRLEYGNISALQRLDAAEFLLFHGTKRDRTREIITSGASRVSGLRVLGLRVSNVSLDVSPVGAWGFCTQEFPFCCLVLLFRLKPLLALALAL